MSNVDSEYADIFTFLSFPQKDWESFQKEVPTNLLSLFVPGGRRSRTRKVVFLLMLNDLITKKDCAAIAYHFESSGISP